MLTFYCRNPNSPSNTEKYETLNMISDGIGFMSFWNFCALFFTLS